MEKWLILGPQQRKYIMSLENLVVLESQHTDIDTHTHTHTHTHASDGSMSKGHKSQVKEFPIAKSGSI